MKALSIGQLVRSVRESKRLSLTAMGYELGVSEAAIRQYEANVRQAKVPFLKLLAEAAPLDVRKEIDELLPEHLRGRISIKIGGRRYSAEAILAAHEALDLIFDHAPSEVIKDVQRRLDKHAAQWRKD